MKIDPSKKASAFSAETESLFKVDSLKGGTQAMRAAGQTFLPQHPEELDENYQKRLSGSTLVNYYTKHIDAAVGRAFAKPLTVNNLPAALTPFLNDIDGTRSTIDQFAQEGLWNTIHHGAGYILADYPSLEEPPKTLADQIQISARPYLVYVQATQVLAAYSTVDYGQERLSHFRWAMREVVPSEDGMDEQTVDVVKAYSQPELNGPITLRTWRKLDAGWTEMDPVNILGVNTIPVVCAYGWRTGFFTGRPVLLDLADLNVAHWNSLSEQTHILSIARVPFIAVTGNNLTVNEPQPDGSTKRVPFNLSVHKMAVLPEGATTQWVETQGKSIAAGAENVKYLEEKMESMGLVPLTSKSGNVTATETAINSAQASVQLKALCQSFADALSQALFLMSQYAGQPAPNVEVSIDASFEVDAPQGEQPAPEGELTN